MEALGINLGYLLVQIIAFIVIYTLMTRFIYTPLMNTLRERRQTIAKGIEDAAAAAEARQNAEDEAEKILSQARTEAAQIVEEARARGEEVAQNIESEARQEADQILQEARTDAQAERNVQLANLRGQVASISMAVAQRLIGETLDESRQKELIDRFFTAVPEEAKSLTGKVEVISAMPLSDEEKEKVKNQIQADDITFSVDPSILGGVVVRSQERVVDGSVRSGLGEISARLN